MKFDIWLKKSIGRIFCSAKTHLIDTGKLLNFNTEIVERMSSSSDEGCEELFLEQVQTAYGDTVDWRAKPVAVRRVFEKFLRPEGQSQLVKVQLASDLRPPEVVKIIDEFMRDGDRGVRALDSFGDFFIVLVIPRERLAAFDEINKNWRA